MAGNITTVAGRGPVAASDYLADGVAALDAYLDLPIDVWVGDDGSMFIVERQNRVRHIGPDGRTTTIAGTGQAGFSGEGGQATGALLDWPSSIFVAPDGVLYIADYENARVRMICP